MPEEEKEQGTPPAGVRLVVRASMTDDGTRPLPAGTPYYLSPDILVSEPPVQGVPVEVSVLVQNRGLALARGVRARFWWCNPALGVGTGLYEIGISEKINVLPLGGEVLTCTTPWIPEFVNGGHECLFVEVGCADDPVKNSLRSDLDRHVGQRNVQVTGTAMNMRLTLNNPFRTEVFTRVAARSTRLYGVDPAWAGTVLPTFDVGSLAVTLLDRPTASLLRMHGVIGDFDLAGLSFGESARLGDLEFGEPGEPSEDPDREAPPEVEDGIWGEFVVAETTLEPGGTATAGLEILELPPPGALDIHHMVQLAGNVLIGGYAVVAVTGKE